MEGPEANVKAADISLQSGLVNLLEQIGELHKVVNRMSPGEDSPTAAEPQGATGILEACKVDVKNLYGRLISVAERVGQL